MMGGTWGQWAVPIALALVTGGLAHLYLPDGPARSFTASEPGTDPGGPYVLVPADGSRGPSTLLRYGAAPRHAHADFLDLHAGSGNGTHWTWDGRDAACLLGGDCTPQGLRTVPLDNATRAGDAVVGPGNDTLDVTFFLFDGDGFLLATNTPRATWGSLDLHGGFTYVPEPLWHVGPGPAPPGARKVPEYRAEVERLLLGATVGQVRSGVLVEHPYDWYLGPVWLTVRVDGVA